MNHKKTYSMTQTTLVVIWACRVVMMGYLLLLLLALAHVMGAWVSGQHRYQEVRFQKRKQIS
jgi:hypothetical protein